MSKERRLDVYVSSTSKDLADHRQAVIQAILDLNYHPVAMENYGAVASPPLDKCLNDVRACDVYVLLVAWRYGFIPDGYDQSITELEYGAWEDDGANVISLVAFGGVGKSALVGEWLQRFGLRDWRGARYVLGHSFYSQGAREDAQASADAFWSS